MDKGFAREKMGFVNIALLEARIHVAFDSISRAPGIHTRLFCLIGSEDISVPPKRSEKLVDAWGGDTNLISFPGENHFLLFHNNNRWTDILDFLKNSST
jgi:pimeloyl-ACP methyl ester carboxylesterase